MKNLLTFLILLVCALQLPAQTNIGGSIDVDFTLNLAGSPYIVTTNLTVEDGATLTIDPGVEIKFNSSKYLFVYGSIVADEAIFTSSNITPGIGDWEYIQIGDNTYQGTGTFEGCTFEYGDKIFLYSGVANFTGCLVQKMYYHGFETSGQLTVFNTTINLEGHIASTNYGFGVNAFAGSIVNIDGCEFLNCNRGLHSEGTSIISNSNMQNCAYGIYCSGQTTADNLSIINCTQRGIMISGGNVEISNSTIQNCVYGCYSNGQFTATNVTISNCTQSGISIYEESVISLTDVEIFTCLWPIYYSGPGALSVSGDLNIHDNTTDAAYVAFSNLYADWELPDLNPVQPENLNEYTPYYFSSGFTVNESARLIISSNCVVKFALYQGLNIKGKLLAQANPGEYIYFTSIYDDNWGGDTNNDGTTTSPAVNNWQGINFQDESVDAECILSRCKVRFGSYNNKGGINCYNASPTIDACEITNNYFGFYLKNASNPTITNNTIGSSLMTPVALSFEASPTFSNNILSSSDNQYDAIGILGGEIITDAVLPVRTFTEVENITYVLLGIVTVPENLSLTIDPGVVIKSFDYNHYLLVDGKFIMDGTADDPIVITSIKDDNYGNPMDTNKDGTQTSPVVGDWGGILMRETSSNLSVYDHCIFKYGEFYRIHDNGYQYYDGCLLLRNTSPTITNCEFGNVVHGIMAKFTSNPVIANCNFFNTESTPVAISLTANPSFSDNTFNNTGLAGIGLLGEEVSFGGTLPKRDVAGYENISYAVLSDITINSGTFINVEPGVVIKLDHDDDIIVNGGLKAEGTLVDNIIFSSIHDDNVGNPADLNQNGNATVAAPGDWGILKYTGTSVDDSCSLKYCNFRYGGNGTVYFEDASGTLQNSVMESAFGHGVICNGISEPVMDDVLFQNCTSAPVGMSLLSNPAFNQIQFISNGYKGIQIIDNSLSSNATLNKRSIAGIENVAYIIYHTLTIDPEATLIINDGVVVKFIYEGNYYNKGKILVNGAIKTIGSVYEPVIFTSDRDDSAGGDTNNDGNNSTPAKGDWYCIELNSAAIDTVNLFTYTKFRYGGYYHVYYDSYKKTYGELRINNSFAQIENCTFEQSFTSGLGVFGNSDPNIISSTFKNIEHTPITMSMFSNPQFSGNSFSNVGIAALGITIEDWSVDANVPKRNFGGSENMTYYLYANKYLNSYYHSKITNGTTITIPEGVVFKFDDYSYNQYKNLQVNGKLVCNGSTEHPIVFTLVSDDDFGNPKDTNGDGSASLPEILTYWYWLEFTDISNDASVLDHVIFRYQNDAIVLNQASPTIKNCTFAHNNFGIRLNGVSEPVVDSCIFDDLTYTPLRLSLVSYPASTSGNIISGSTYKALGVLGETLSQEISLHNRDFAGIEGIPYYFHDNYTIGTSGGISVEPGVIVKFNDDYSSKLNVKNYLTAIGGNAISEKIIFTDIRDDFFGGDTNADSTSTIPGYSNYNIVPWRGIYFENESFDEQCIMDHCAVCYAGNYYSNPPVNYKAGINLNSASPTITNTLFLNNAKGLVASGASNPLVNNCNFSGQLHYALENQNQAFTINAENCWWGDNSGPTHPGNPGGTGEPVTDGVDYDPWYSDGAIIPVSGDVSLNGKIQAYDAALVLQYAVGLITLNDRQLEAADVSDNGTVTAYDASLILQYVIGFINYFPVWDRSPEPAPKDGGASLLIENLNTKPGEAIKIPVWVNDVNGLYSSDVILKYDQKYLEFKGIKFKDEFNGLYSASGGQIKMGFASSQAINNNFRLAILEFVVNPQIFSPVTTEIFIEKFLADEIDCTALSTNGIINIIKTQEGPPSTGLSGLVGFECFPNPFNHELNIQYIVNNDLSIVHVEILDVAGKTVKTLTNGKQTQGHYQLKWNGRDNFDRQVQNGLYIVRLLTDDRLSVKKVHYIK